MRKILLALAMLSTASVLAACAETIHLRNPNTGQAATCGPYRTGGIGAQAGAILATQCVQDFKEQGYVRVAR